MSDLSFRELVDYTLKADYDMLLPITGRKGTGKSVLAYHIANAIDPEFKLRRNITFRTDLKTVEEKIYGLPRYSVPIFDEVITGMDNQDFAGRLQKSLYKLFTVSRKENKCSILCIPRFSRLLRGIREDHCAFWLHVIDRGVVVVFKADENAFGNDPWNIEYNQKLWDRIRKGPYMTTGELLDAYRKSKNYFGHLSFDDWPSDKIKNEYLGYYQEEKQKISEELRKEQVVSEPRNSKLLRGLKRLIYEFHETGTSYAKMARMIQEDSKYKEISEDTIEYFVNGEKKDGL